MEELEVKTATYLLSCLAEHYPERRAGLNSESWRRLAAEYCEDFSRAKMSIKDLRESIPVARGRCKFFPKSSEIIQAHQENLARRPAKPTPLMLREARVYSPEKAKENKRRLALLVRVFAKEITAEDAIGKMRVER